jgi:DNA-binding response OmpR family regulator
MFKAKIMIVDDDREFLEELKETLDLNGFEVIGVNDSTKVKEMVKNTKPDVIMLDLKMDDMSGFEVAEELKQFSNTMQIPIIAMTGFFKEDEHIPLLNICGIKKCIAKPFNPKDVIKTIEAVLKKTAKES